MSRVAFLQTPVDFLRTQTTASRVCIELEKEKKTALIEVRIDSLARDEPKESLVARASAQECD